MKKIVILSFTTVALCRIATIVIKRKRIALEKYDDFLEKYNDCLREFDKALSEVIREEQEALK